MSTPESDALLRFHFEHGNVRGGLVRLETSLREVLAHHYYPEAVSVLIGEALAAVVLMSATLKLDATLSLQAKSAGAVSLLFAECDSGRRVRGYARVREGAAASALGQLLEAGTVAITITPAQGERYQGIVPLDADTLGGCLEHYFRQSEQLPTALYLACDGHRAAGLMLQAVPQAAGLPDDDRRWEHLSTLAATVSARELLGDPFETLLYHLYHEERVRLQPLQPVRFGCSCSEARAAATLAALGEGEARALVEEQGVVRIHCEFCQQEYAFGAPDLARLFEAPAGDAATIH